MRKRSISCLLVFALLVLGAAGCGDDDPTGATDTTAPVVLSFDPGSDDTGVGLDDDILIVFNENMDPASAAGQITLSAGTVIDLSWDDARTLRVAHSVWAEGIRVDVTVGTGLRDAAGNALAAAVSSGFWTFTSSVLLLETDPADGATNVLRNTVINLLFSQRMDLGSLQQSITVDDGTVGRVPLEFSLSEADGDRVRLSFFAALAASRTHTVTIAAGAQSNSGATLAETVSFSFTTGTAVDNTPPTLVSITPADDTDISPNTAAIVMTFSEAIDPDRFSPDRIGAQFLLLLDAANVEPTWSADGRVLTVPLPTPLPAGLPIEVDFDEFYDLAGNASTSGIDYQVDVSGTPDPWPFVDGAMFAYFGTQDEGSGVQTYEYFQRIERQNATDVHFSRYRDVAFTQFDGWDVYRRSSTQILLLGFREVDNEVASDVSLVPPPLFLKLPVVIQSWTGTSTASFPDGDVTIDYQVEVLGKETIRARIIESGAAVHVPLLRVEFGPRVEWIDCWKTVLSYQMSDGIDTVSAGADSMWYAPTIGLVRSVSSEVNFQQETTRESEEDLIGVSFAP